MPEGKTLLRAVKYCGGCNPRYDRVKLVRQLEQRLGESLPSAQPDVLYDELYVICGCSARCADMTALRARQIVSFDHEADCMD